MDLPDSGASPNCAPLSAMPLLNATGYRMGFMLFPVANSIFTLEEFVITISFLRFRYSQIACARTLGIRRDYCIQVLRDVLQQAHLWDTFTDALDADGNSTNTVIQFSAMCLPLSIARTWPSSHLRTR